MMRRQAEPSNTQNTVRERFRVDSKAQPRNKNDIKPGERERLGDFPPWEIFDSMSYYRINKEEIIFSHDQLKRQHRGARSLVIKGNLRARNLNVAVKMFEYEQDSDRERLTSSFVHELRLLRNLNHENIVKAARFVASYKEKIAWTVFPWQENGNLKEFVSSEYWRLPERVSLLYDVASGLEYLHGQKPPIYHGNLTPLNILVNEGYNAVITGFCSAHVLDSPEVDPGHLTKQAPLQASADDALRVDFQDDTGIITLTGPLSSFRLVVPELLSGSQSSLAGDTWAFGWVCWEVLGGPIPLGDTKSDSTIVTYTIKGYMFGIEGSEAYGVIKGLCQLLSKFWSPYPTKRYNAAECRKDISFMPMKLPRADESNYETRRRSSPLVRAIGEVHGQSPEPDASYPFDPRYAIATPDDPLERGRELLRDKSFSGAERSFILAGNSYARRGFHIGCADAIHGLGEVYGAQEMLDHAESCFAAAKWIGTLLCNNERTAQATLRLGVVSRRQGRLSKAGELLAEALQNYTKMGDDYGRIDTLYELGSLDLQQDLCVEAEERFSEALQICALIGDNQCTDVLQKFGNLYLEQRQYSKAKELYTRALSVLISSRRNTERAWIHRQLGDLYRDWGRYTKAEDHYTQAFTTYKKEGDLDHGIMLDRLGGLYLKQGRYTEAEEHCTQALKLWTSKGLDAEGASNQYRAGTLQKLGDLCRTQARYSEARDHLSKAINILTSEEARPGRAGMLRELADLYQMQGRYSDAADHLTEALSIDTSLGDGPNRAETLRRLGELHQKQRRHSKAEENLTEAQTAYASLGDRFTHAEVLLQLENLYKTQSRDLEAGKRRSEAMLILRSMGAKSDDAHTLRKVGKLYQHQGRYTKAGELFKKALAISAQIEDISSLAETLRRLGELSRRKARYSSADRNFTMAVKMYTLLGDYLGQKRAESSSADIRRLQCRFADAEAAFQEVGAFYNQIGFPLGAAYTKCSLGNTYRQQGKHREAFELYREAQNVFEKLNHAPGLADSAIGLGQVLRLQGQYSRAYSCFFEAGVSYLSVGNKTGLVEAAIEIGDLYRFQGRYSKANKAYLNVQNAYQRAGSKNHPLELAGATCGLGYIHCSQGRHSEAHSCFEEAKSLYDRVGNQLGVAETFCGMGDLHRSQGDYLKAEESYTEAQTIYRQLDHSLGVGEVACGLGYLRRMECRDAEAKSLFSEAQKLCSEKEHGLGAANAALGLATVHLARMECDSAASDARKALDFYTQADVLPSKARALLILAQIRGLEHHDDESRAYIDEASAIFSEIGDEKGVSLCREHRLHLAHPNVETPTVASTEEQHALTG